MLIYIYIYYVIYTIRRRKYFTKKNYKRDHIKLTTNLVSEV